MKYSLFTLAALVALSFTSCANDPDEVNYDKIEQDILDSWIQEKIDAGNPDFVGFERSDANYWYRVENPGDTDGDLTSSMKSGWVRYNFSGFDLENNMCVTRNEQLAYQANTFNNDVRYIPLIQELYPMDDAYDLMPDCVKFPLKDKDIALREGSVITLYIPSKLIGNASYETSGFTGQYELADGRPMKAVMEVVEIVKNGETWEEAKIDLFTNKNGGIFYQYNEEAFEGMDEDEIKEAIEESNKIKEEYPRPWSQSIDSVEYLYAFRNYTPDFKFNYTDPEPYSSQIPTSIYNKYTMKELDTKIAEILKNRFPDTSLKGNRIGEDGYVTIWYIGRYLDGFIFDTNIDEVKELITGQKVETASSAIYYTPKEDYTDYVISWYYTIPQLRFGQWASILTSSPYAYGTYPEDANIQPYSPMLFQIYIEQEN